MRLNT